MATIYDVARRAGVSHTTVSAALNSRTGQVGDETRRRVLEAARELGYRPSRIARQLATGRTNTIAVCFAYGTTDAFTSPNSGRLVAAIGNKAGQTGTFLLFAPTGTETSLEDQVSSLPFQGVDGAIVVGAMELDDAAISAIDSCPIPLVCIDSYPGFKNASTVDTDSVAAMRDGVMFLLGEGHRNICFFGPPPLYQCHIDRIKGFYEGFRQNQMETDDVQLHSVSISKMTEILLDLLSGGEGPTAVVCDRWDYGMAAWDLVQQLGMRVPDDITLLLFDNLPRDHPGTKYVNALDPAPTAMGLAAMDILAKTISGELEEPVNLRVPAEMTLRPSPVPKSRIQKE